MPFKQTQEYSEVPALATGFSVQVCFEKFPETIQASDITEMGWEEVPEEWGSVPKHPGIVVEDGKQIGYQWVDPQPLQG